MADESKSAAGEDTFRRISVTEFGGPEVLRVATARTTALAPGDDQVLIHVAYAGVNPVDTYIRTGTYARTPALPYTPGADAAGVVLAVGSQVSHVKVGQRVYAAGSVSGTYSERALCSAAQVHPLPDDVGLDVGAAVGVPAYTAYRALFVSTRAEPGQWVLVHGASGAVGYAAVQLAVDAGMRVIGTAGSAAGLELVKSAGATHAFNHREEGYAEEIVAATGGTGVDVILEMLANVNLSSDLQMLARGGIVGVIGNRGEITINPRDLMAKESRIVGVALAGMTAPQKAQAEAYVNAKLASRALKPVVGPVFSLEEAAAAHKDVIEHAGGSSGKVLIKCADI